MTTEVPANRPTNAHLLTNSQGTPAVQAHPTTWEDDLRPATRWWIMLLLLPLLAVLAFAILRPIQVLPRMALAPAFAFTDERGAQLTSEMLRGGITLYTFAHSRCTSPCVPTTTALTTLHPHLADLETDGIPLRFVTIYVDPEDATSPTLIALADSVRAQVGGESIAWHFVTGDSAQLKSVIGAGFHTYYQTDDRAEADGSFVVDPVFVLVDGMGLVRATYRTAAPDADHLVRDLRLIVQEIRNSTGVTRYAYEAAHLFMCYPR
jgi:protein SCO1/2